MTSFNVPSGQSLWNRSTAGPMIYNGQVVTGQIYFYPNGSTQSIYWMVTSSGVKIIGSVYSDGTVTSDGTFWSQNTNPGQTASDSNNNVSTFVGFQTVNLAGKTFTNTCHFNAVGNQGSGDVWYAPGYGVIKQVGATGTVQYNGDL